jgi:hypothetical protein
MRIPVKIAAMMFDTVGLKPPIWPWPVPFVTLTRVFMDACKDISVVVVVMLANVFTNKELSVVVAVTVANVFINKEFLVVFAVILAKVFVNKGIAVVFKVLLAKVLTTICNEFPVVFAVMLAKVFMMVGIELSLIFDVMFLVACRE